MRPEMQYREQGAVLKILVRIAFTIGIFARAEFLCDSLQPHKIET